MSFSPPPTSTMVKSTFSKYVSMGLFFTIPIVFFLLLSLIIFSFDPRCEEGEDPDKCLNSPYLPIFTMVMTACFSYIMFITYLGENWYLFIIPLFLSIMVIVLIHYLYFVPKYFPKHTDTTRSKLKK